MKNANISPAHIWRRRLAVSVASAGMALMAGPALAQMAGATEPSFSCATAKTITEKTICADTSLTQRDAVMNRIYQALKKDGKAKKLLRQQLVWIKQRNLCREDKACLEKKYSKRIRDLARAAGDSTALSGTYLLQPEKPKKDGAETSPSTGNLWLAREADGTLAGHIYVTGGGTPAHTCAVAFRGALPLGDKWLWSTPASELLSRAPCHILFERGQGAEKNRLKLSRTTGCNLYCGANAEFAGHYLKQPDKKKRKSRKKK